MDNDKELPPLTIQEALLLPKDSVDIYKRKLKDRRFDFDSIDEKGKTLLINLVETMPNSDFVWLILEYFADPNVKDMETEKTALHFACKTGNKGMILALLMFGALPDIADKDEKKPFELITNFREEIEPLPELFNKTRPYFIQLTRKRRKILKKIFDEISQGTGYVDRVKMTDFYMNINGEAEEVAVKDAELFIEHAKLFKSDASDYSSMSSIIYEEFIFAMIRILQKHSMKVIDQFLDKYKASQQTKKIGDLI